VQDYLTEPARMKRFYAAIRGKRHHARTGAPVFRSNADMMLLTTRLRIDPDGRVHIPGGMDVWKDLFTRSPKGKYDAKTEPCRVRLEGCGRRSRGAVRALCRKPVDNEPLKIFMALTDIDRSRPQPLKPETVAASGA
jgi:hypothetical protein